MPDSTGACTLHDLGQRCRGGFRRRVAFLGSPPLLKYAGAVVPIAGLDMIIWSGWLLVIENKLINTPLDREADDLPEFHDGRPADGQVDKDGA